MEKENQTEISSLFLAVLKGVITAIFVTLVGVLIFAFVIKMTGISSSAIRPVNQVIKSVSIFVGTLLGLKKNKSKGLVKGVLIGLFYAIISFVLFSILNKSFALNITLLIDIVFLSAIGAILGIICSLILKN